LYCARQAGVGVPQAARVRAKPPVRAMEGVSMPKMKTNKSVAKRVKLTARGRLKHWRPMRGHLKSTKSSKRLRGLRKSMLIPKQFEKTAKRLLGM
jgi:large subunit ribosomal protein L35